MYNPLHFDHTEMVQQTEMGNIKAHQVPLDGTFREESNAEDFCHVPAFNEFGKEDLVHCWSVDDVVSWVQENVPIQSERLEGILLQLLFFFVTQESFNLVHTNPQVHNQSSKASHPYSKLYKQVLFPMLCPWKMKMSFWVCFGFIGFMHCRHL